MNSLHFYESKLHLYQQYHDNKVFFTIWRDENRSHTSPNLSSSSGACSSPTGMDVLLTLAILRKIAFASSVLPFTINHRTDSGVRLNKQKEMFSSVLVQSLFSKDIKSPSLVDRDVSVVITLIIISLNGRFLLSRYLVSSRIAPSPSPNGCFNHCFIPFPLLWMRGTATHSKP